jgi:hypothetical protein
MTTRENRPTEGAVHEVPAKGPTSMVQGRIETILDSLLRSLAPLAAR